MDPVAPPTLGIIGRFLRNHSAVTALVGTRSSLKLTSSLPAIRYSLVAGQPRQTWEYLPQFQVETWTTVDGEELAEEIALTVRAAWPDIVGRHGDALIAGYDVTVEPFQSNDPTTNRARFIQQVQLFAMTDPQETP